MSEARLPRKSADQVVELEIRHLILGCIVAGSTVALLVLALNGAKDRARLRRQEALLQGLERLLQMIRQIRAETTTNPGKNTEGDH